MRHMVCGGAREDNRGTRDRRESRPDHERRGADGGALPAPARLRPRAMPGFAQRLNRPGCLERVLYGRRALSPEVVGPGRQRRL